MRLNEGVHAACVSVELLAVFWCGGQQTFLGSCPDSEDSLLAVVLERNFANNFGEFTGCGPAHQIHLKQPVLCGHVALREKEILESGRFDSWNAMTVTSHTDRGRHAGHWERSIQFGKRRAGDRQ